MLGTIWFDVTLIGKWNGPPVGIVRVQAETARRLLSEFGGKTRFCRFDKKRETHIVVPHKDVDIRIRMLDEYVEGPASRSDPGSWPEAKGFVKRVVARLPRRVETVVIHSVRMCRRGAARTERALFGPVCRFLAFLHLISAGIETEIRRGDVYVNLDIDIVSGWLPRMYRVREKTGIRVVGMCYDLIPINTPHFIASDYTQEFSLFVRALARGADMIACISRHTLRDLETYMSSVEGARARLGVIPLGGDLGPARGEPGDRVAALCRTPYILYVSTIEIRKNHAILYRAYKELLRAGRRDLPRLVFAGRPGWKVDELVADLRLDREVDGLIVTLGNVNDAELSCLYRNCLFTVYPSLYEGWGLPIAESLAHGKFCIASSASSLPEVGGGFVDYLEPLDLPGWVERLASYIDNPQALREREAKIRSGYRPPTWSDTARTLVEFASALAEKPPKAG